MASVDLAEQAALLEEELEAVQACYPQAARWHATKRQLTVTLPGIVLRLKLPAGYPAQAPTFGMDPVVGVTVSQVEALEAELKEIIVGGEGDMVLLPCISTAEEAGGAWEPDEPTSAPCEPASASGSSGTAQTSPHDTDEMVTVPSILHGTPVVERKSTVSSLNFRSCKAMPHALAPS